MYVEINDISGTEKDMHNAYYGPLGRAIPRLEELAGRSILGPAVEGKARLGE